MAIGIFIGNTIGNQRVRYWTPQKKAANAPTLLTATLYSDNQIDLSWTNNGSGYTGHKIYLSRDNTNFYLRDTTNSVGTYYRVNDLTIGQIYYFKIVSYQGSNVSDYSNTANATTDKWYLQSGLVAGDCVAVYEPLKARNLTEAKVNVITPGTKNLTNGVAPAFDPDGGLVFTGNEYLKTGVIPANTNYSMIIRFVDAQEAAGSTYCLGGAYSSATKVLGLQNSVDGTPRKASFYNGGVLTTNGSKLSGTLAVAGNVGYRDGIADAGNVGAGTASTHEVYIGALNFTGSAIQKYVGKICLVAIYNRVLTPTQVLAVHNRMMTVSRGGVWELQGKVLEATIPLEESNVFEPSVIYETGAQILETSEPVFKMWHSIGWHTPNIGYAESLTGMPGTWVKYPTPVIADMCRGFVYKIGTTYHLFCADVAATHIDHYTSEDGVSFTLYAANLVVKGTGSDWDHSGIANSSVISENGNIYLFYDGITTIGSYWKTGLAISNDGGLTATKTGTPVIVESVLRGATFIKKVGSLYYIWLLGNELTVGVPSDFPQRYVSSDLMTWAKDTVKYIYMRTTADEGVDSAVGQIGDPFLLEVNNKVYMFYTGTSDGTQEAGAQVIKLAIADMPFSRLVLTEEGNKL